MVLVTGISRGITLRLDEGFHAASSHGEKDKGKSAREVKFAS